MISAAALAPPPTHPAVALMARETRVREGAVPSGLAGKAVAVGQHLLADDAFLLRAPGGIGLAYRRGEGITLERTPEADAGEVALWLNGTVYAAVAAINGLFPFHASAVAHEGRVFAFTGPAGGGKSTLVAALGAAGFAHFCDDTLILDVSGEGPPTCLPGHKRMKLWPEGAALARAHMGELVAERYPKHYVDPPAGAVSEPLPLGELIFLEAGHSAEIVAIRGGERIARLEDDHYTAQLWLAARGAAPARRFAELAALAVRIGMHRFVRPFDAARFAEGVALAARHIRSA